MMEWAVRIFRASMWTAALVVAAALYAVFSPLLLVDYLSSRRKVN